MSKKNTPTASMRKFAADGVNLFTAGNFPVNSSITPKAVEVGKKIASGQDLSNEHVDDMAHYHSAHDTCPKDVEDLLWGGPAGEVWAKGKITQSMNTGFAEEKIDFNKLISDKDLDLSLEIYSDIKLDEPVETGDDGLIWAPILRSGMLATRPGPNGEKLDEPLVFVPGRSQNQRKEIGMQDIVDAFNDKAIEYVTLPLSHENNLLENTGFIKELKMVDSKKFPGEKVILAAHEFTEPEIKGKVERGTIPSRSSGILYDYKNTTTGKVYPVALDHTALTHKPWMGGMTPYGKVSAEDFSERTVIPMMLSEKPFSAESPDISKPTKLAQEIIKPPQQTKVKEEFEGEFLADVQWGEDPSYRDVEKQIGRILDGFGSDYDSYPNYYLIDCTGDKALIKVDYGIGSDQDAWVAPYTCTDDGKVQLAPFADWIDVTKKWVSDTIDPKQDKEQLDKLKMSNDKDVIIGLYLSVTQAERDKAKKNNNSLPDGSYPIEDAKHLHSAAILAASGHGDVAAAKSLIRRRAKELGVDVNSLPGFGPKKGSKSEKMAEPLKEASVRRLGLSESEYEPIGGQMTLLAMSEEKMDLLGLSDEAKEFQRKQNAEITKLSIKLAESQKKEKETRVANRITELKAEGFDAFPGILTAYETTALSDDGDIAVKLQLSEHGHDVSVAETATELAERFIKAIPRKDKKVDLGEFANKLETPITDRPQDKPEDITTSSDRKDMTGEDLLAEMLAADPSLAKEPMILALSENGKGK